MATLVPVPIQHILVARAGVLAYAPTRAPFGYRYLSYSWNAPTRTEIVRLHDRHYRAGNARHTVTFRAQRFSGTPASCGAGNEKSYQVDGNKVWSAGGDLAWRCVRGASGKLVKLSAVGQNLPASTLAIVVSSAKHLP